MGGLCIGGCNSGRRAAGLGAAPIEQNERQDEDDQTQEAGRNEQPQRCARETALVADLFTKILGESVLVDRAFVGRDVAKVDVRRRAEVEAEAKKEPAKPTTAPEPKKAGEPKKQPKGEKEAAKAAA